MTTGAADVIEGLSHLVIRVNDLDAAEAFYRDGLGMQPRARDSWGEDAPHAVLSAGGQTLVLVEEKGAPDGAACGVHQAYRMSRPDRDAARGRLGALGFRVEDYVETRPAEKDDNCYVIDPAGNRAQLVANGANGADDRGGVTGIDHACVEDFDMQWAETFYGRVLGLAVDHTTGLRTDDYLLAQAWGAEKFRAAPGCCRLVRYYREVPGQNRMQPRPTLQMYFRAGDGVLGIYMAVEDYAEPPEHQLKGTPRTAFRVRPGRLDVVERALGARPHEGPVAVEGGGRAVFCRDTGGNFLEFREG